jgi:hypothetical protein
VAGWFDEVKKFMTPIVPFVKIAVSYLKAGIAFYFTEQAAIGEFAGSNKGIIIGALAAGAGLIAQYIGLRTTEGAAISDLEKVGLLLSGLAFVTTCALSFGKWSNPADGLVIPFPHKLEAVVHLCTTGIQVIGGVIVFGMVVDSVVKSNEPNIKHRILPETFSWIAGFLDQAANIMSTSAVLVPVAGGSAKVILIGGAFIGKTAAWLQKTLEVIALKVILEKFARHPATTAAAPLVPPGGPGSANRVVWHPVPSDAWTRCVWSLSRSSPRFSAPTLTASRRIAGQAMPCEPYSRL